MSVGYDIENRGVIARRILGARLQGENDRAEGDKHNVHQKEALRETTHRMAEPRSRGTAEFAFALMTSMLKHLALVTGFLGIGATEADSSRCCPERYFALPPPWGLGSLGPSEVSDLGCGTVL
jgi:hypothetical protein